ncbi:MAG: DNA alkylation repair protein [Bacteroidia bacterium]|nr:DNA alkylation repair protein [Bacteroidia bacterium]
MLETIQTKLSELATQAGADATHKFVPSATRVYGVRMPLLNALAREYKAGGFALAEALWASGAFEERILAAKLLEKVGRHDPARIIRLVTRWSAQIDNWAVCDALGMQGIKGIVKTHRPQIFNLSASMLTSRNPWRRRLALVLIQYYTRDAKAKPAIMKHLRALEHDDEYYVQKAVAWIKRNFAKGR